MSESMPSLGYGWRSCSSGLASIFVYSVDSNACVDLMSMPGSDLCGMPRVLSRRAEESAPQEEAPRQARQSYVTQWRRLPQGPRTQVNSQHAPHTHKYRFISLGIALGPTRQFHFHTSALPPSCSPPSPHCHRPHGVSPHRGGVPSGVSLEGVPPPFLPYAPLPPSLNPQDLKNPGVL